MLASGARAAAPNTATNPNPASQPIGTPNNPLKAFPSVAPIKNSGVASPPRNPLPTVTAVNPNLTSQSQAPAGPTKAAAIFGTPSPANAHAEVL